MNNFFGYIRVSTARQGVHGVSLQEQREAIARHAERYGFQVVQWFEERESAAKRGRPIFSRMVKDLLRGRASGVIIHKVDRSARNSGDWADLEQLLDRGINVQIANNALDLSTRGGRLTANIEAVVAADYSRNLREETKKGFYGRLKQGLLPMPAPLGYRNIGGGKPKELDRDVAPLVKQVFELYATARFGFHQLLTEIRKMGLCGRGGKPLTLNGLSKLLKNPFYAGLIHIHKTGETFKGVHEPLIPATMFERVQDILQGKVNTRCQRHDFLLRRRIVCKDCQHTLIGETHKTFVYYRCQTRACPTTAIREEAAELAIRNTLLPLQLTKQERRYCYQHLEQFRADRSRRQDEIVAGLELQLSQLSDRLVRVTDAYIDRLIEKDIFEQRKTALLMERRMVEESLAEWRNGERSEADELQEFLEQGNSAYSTYISGNPDEKRELVDSVTSNRLLNGKSLEVMLASPFDLIANRAIKQDGSPSRGIPRTWARLFKNLLKAIHRRQAEMAHSPILRANA